MQEIQWLLQSFLTGNKEVEKETAIKFIFHPAFLIFFLFSLYACYEKTTSSKDGTGNCDLENVTLKITKDPLPYLEEQTGCIYPVFANIEYRVTNNTENTIFIETLNLKAYNDAGEKFFDWVYIDQNHHTLDPGRWYTVRLNGILVDGYIDHTPNLDLINGKHILKAELIYNGGEDASCGSFSAKDESELRTAVTSDICE